MTIDFKLANVILRVDDHATAHPELYYRAGAGAASYDETVCGLRLAGAVDFLTYVNAFSAIKWRQYTGLEHVRLQLEAVGSGRVAVTGVPVGQEVPMVIFERAFVGTGEPVTFDLDIDIAGYDLVGFTVTPDVDSVALLSRAHYYAQVDEEDINSIGLALSTTTFQKEDFIIPNIELVKRGIAAEGDPMASHFHMFVVDNGRTLDVAGLSDDVVTVIPNPNTGGAGGFARGMIAALDEPERFTHVLLMDDDVRIMPESLIRTFSLLSLARGRYRDAFINGAMLSLEDPARQYEDVGYVPNDGIYARVKEDKRVDQLRDVLDNERTSVEVPNAYGAWWYSCIPLSAIRAKGLPMPFFVRCDDVEFGMRNKPTYMTMGGICVWHASFEGRFRASVDCYQYTRNFLAMVAMDDCSSEEIFMMRFRRTIRRNLRDLDYSASELLLNGLDDYLKGPDYLAAADGAALMKANGARNEKMLPVSELDAELLAEAGVTPEVLSHVDYEVHQPEVVRLWMKFWRSVPYDKHYLPDALLAGHPSYVVKKGTVTLEGDSMRHSVLVFLEPTRKTGCVRRIDKARFKTIRKRERDLLRRWRQEGKAVRAKWKAAQPYLASREFWEEKLGMR